MYVLGPRAETFLGTEASQGECFRAGAMSVLGAVVGTRAPKRSTKWRCAAAAVKEIVREADLIVAECYGLII